MLRHLPASSGETWTTRCPINESVDPEPEPQACRILKQAYMCKQWPQPHTFSKLLYPTISRKTFIVYHHLAKPCNKKYSRSSYYLKTSTRPQQDDITKFTLLLRKLYEASEVLISILKATQHKQDTQNSKPGLYYCSITPCQI